MESTNAARVIADIGVALDSAEAGPKATRSLHARATPLVPPTAQLALLDELILTDDKGQLVDFDRNLPSHGHEQLRAGRLELFQVNLGKLCNMTCKHCHVDAGPDRAEAMMSRETVEQVVRAVQISGADTVDITGGAPELHPDFRFLVQGARAAGKHVIDRCNLTILLVPRFRDLPAWLADNQVEIVASLPHFRQLNTDAQRGNGAFSRSIEAMRQLNQAGYGKGDPDRVLTLMSNPAGAFIGGCQQAMTDDWRDSLRRHHGVTFDRLLVLNNMPIARYLEWLLETNNLRGYMQTLIDAFNPAALDGLMCRNTISVSWDGRIYDCDFNQMLDIEAKTVDHGFLHVADFDPARLAGRQIQTARHCFGCTAGAGSSCGGATT